MMLLREARFVAGITAKLLVVKQLAESTTLANRPCARGEAIIIYGCI